VKSVVVRPLVVLSLVAAAWSQAPAANAAKGHPTSPASTTGGMHVTSDGHTEVYTSTQTVLATGAVEVFEFSQEFDQRGLLVHTKRALSEDGVETQRMEEALTYGQAQRLSKVVTVDDPDGAGPLPASTRVDTLDRNQRHVLVSVTSTIDVDSDGTIDSTETESPTFDARGRKITSRIQSGDNVTVESYVYDSHGNILSDTIDTDDLTTPQSPDTRQVDTTAYGAHSIITGGSHQSFVFDAQGTAVLTSRSDQTVTLASQNGPVTKTVDTFDNDGDGHVDATATATSTYDESGNPVESTYVYDDATDHYEASQLYTSDTKGRIVRVVAQESLDGSLLDRVVTDNTFDKLGRQVRAVDTWDRDGDGQTDDVDTQVGAYDHRDRVVAVSSTVRDASGTLMNSQTTTIVYGQDTETQTSLFDDDGDGVVDRTVVEVTTG
jgi:hypothetical protein